MKKSIHILVSFVLALMICGSALMALFWLPCAAEHISGFVFDSKTLPFYLICAVIALPFVAILFIAFSFPFSIRNDTVFTAKTAKRIKIISFLLFADCIMLLVAAVVFLISGDTLISPALCFISLIGMTVALMLFILSGYVKKAAILKEESDYTL